MFAVMAGAIAVAAPRLAAQERQRPKADSAVRGTLEAVDAEKSTVTIVNRAFDRKSGEATETKKTYTVAREAKIIQDEAAAKLANLKKGHPVVLTMEGDKAVSVSVIGGTVQVEFRSANLDRNTMLVLGGRDMSRQTLHLLKDTKVLGADGKPIKVQDLKAGTKLVVTKSVEEDGTVVKVQVAGEAPKRNR
jgi:hypothetical protein